MVEWERLTDERFRSAHKAGERGTREQFAFDALVEMAARSNRHRSGPISVRAARELLGDSILKLVITSGTDVVSVTHLGRGPTVAQEVALLWANPVCCVQGCNRIRRLEWDHRHATRERAPNAPPAA